MNKLVKRLLTGTLAFATILTALPVTAVHASGNQYWTESAERVGYIEHVMNDGSIKSTFNEGHMKVEGETAYCVDINTNFKNGYKTRSDASTRMSSDQIADVALSLEYVKQYTASHTNLNYKQGYLLEQCVVWQRLSEQLGWQCDNVRASYNEISQAVQNEVYAGAKAFVKANKGRYECGGYIYTGEGQDIGQFWAKLNVGNAKVKKTSSNPTVTDGNANYSFEGATFGVYSDKSCNSQLATLTADGNGDTKEVEVKAGTVYIKELSAPKGYKLDSTVHSLNVEVGKTATLTVADTPKVTETLIDLFKIDMETGKSTPQGTASLEGAEFTWSYYDGYYNADNLPAKATRTWTTKTVAEKDRDGTIHYVSRLADSYKVSGEQRTQKRNLHRENISQKKQELQKAQEAKQAVHANGSATAGATRSHERPVATSVPKPAQTDTVTKPDMKRPATSPVIKNAEIKAGKETVRTNIRQEQQVKSVTRTNQPNVAESSSNHKKSTVQKTQVNGKSARKTVTKHSEKGRKK